jgi:peptidyl-prolyl cis-trans isomerase D
MLQSIRDRAQGVLAWIIVTIISIPFALWGIHEYLNPSSDIIIADINGSELSRQAFDYEYRRQMQILRSRLGADADLSAFASTIKRNVLAEMVEEELLTQIALKHNMRISDVMLAQEIQNISSFQENGAFSHVAYQQALQIQGMDPAAFEFQVRRSLLIDQFQQAVLYSEILPTDAYAEIQRLQTQQRLVSYARISQNRFQDSIEISAEDLSAYFDTHQRDYYTPEKVSIEYIELALENLAVSTDEALDESALEQRYHEQIAHYTTPAEWQASHILISEGEDSAAALQQAQEILVRLREGEDFAKLAEEFSADPGSAKQGGDLGSFGPGMMVPAFEEALKNMAAGELSEPVKTPFGYHIIKLNSVSPESVREFAEVREEILSAYHKEQADRRFYDMVDQFANLSFEHPDTLDVLADSMGLEKKISELFDRRGGEGILRHSQVIAAAFSDSVMKDGMNSEVLEISDQYMLVLRLKSHEEARPRDFAEVREEVATVLRQQRQREAAQTLAESVLEQLKNNPDRHALAAQHELEWSDTRWVARQDQTLAQPEVVREVFKLGRPAPDQVFYHSIALANGDQAIIALLAVKDGEANEPAPEEESLALGEARFKLLTQALKEQAKIKLYPERLD